MGKFVLRCPRCGTVHKASTSLFAKKIISCGNCGEEINIKESRLTSKICPHCGDVFMYDQAKGQKTICPSCNKEVDAFHAGKFVTLNCPQCACAVEVEENELVHACPICDTPIDVVKEIARLKQKNVGGVSIIQYEGDNSTFIWKHPIEDFNMGSQLIVHESQEAIFFMNGQALDTFGPGRHTLETEVLPIMNKLYKVPAGAQTPFHAEVYFINKTVQMGMKWGTDSRVRFIDPMTQVPLDIGASGEMNLQVCDSRKLLIKLVGTTGGLGNKEVLTVTGGTNVQGQMQITMTPAQKALQTYFRAPLMTQVKSYLSSVIKEQQLDIMEIDAQLGVLSEALQEKISPKFEEYGISIANFYVTYISLPEDDENYKKLKKMRADRYIRIQDQHLEADIARATQERKIVEAQTEASLAAIKAQGEAEAMKATGFAEADIMRAKGYTQRDVLAADVQKAYAQGLGNMGGSGGGGNGSGTMGDIVGVMAGLKMANMAFDKMDFSGIGSFGAAPEAAQNADTWTCECGEAGNTKKFCMNCGKPKPEAWDCACGHKGNKGKFCEECGASKPTTWDCACGQKGNTGKCCPECGARKPE